MAMSGCCLPAAVGTVRPSVPTTLAADWGGLRCIRMTRLHGTAATLPSHQQHAPPAPACTCCQLLAFETTRTEVPMPTTAALPPAGNATGDLFVYSTLTGVRSASASQDKLSGGVKSCAVSEDCRHLLAAIGNGFLFRWAGLGCVVVVSPCGGPAWCPMWWWRGLDGGGGAGWWGCRCRCMQDGVLGVRKGASLLVALTEACSLLLPIDRSAVYCVDAHTVRMLCCRFEYNIATDAAEAEEAADQAAGDAGSGARDQQVEGEADDENAMEEQ